MRIIVLNEMQGSKIEATATLVDCILVINIYKHPKATEDDLLAVIDMFDINARNCMITADFNQSF